MSRSVGDESAFLAAGIDRLRPLLEQHGFHYAPGACDVSSGGSFSTGSFWRGELSIGLIVRNPKALGCPNYSAGHGYAGHTDVFWALGRDGESRLIPGEFPSYVSRDAGDQFVALEADLRDVVLPALRNSEANFLSAISRAHQRFQARLFGGSG